MLHSSLLERCIALRKRPLDLKNDEVRDMWLSSLVRRRSMSGPHSLPPGQPFQGQPPGQAPGMRGPSPVAQGPYRWP